MVPFFKHHHLTYSQQPWRLLTERSEAFKLGSLTRERRDKTQDQPRPAVTLKL